MKDRIKQFLEALMLESKLPRHTFYVLAQDVTNRICSDQLHLALMDLEEESKGKNRVSSKDATWINVSASNKSVNAQKMMFQIPPSSN